MKNVFFTLILILGVSLLNSCVSTEEKKKVDALKAKEEEAKCRADLSKQIYDYGMNAMELGLSLGLKKEIDEFNKLTADSTVNCVDRKKAWEELNAKIQNKWDSENSN